MAAAIDHSNSENACSSLLRCQTEWFGDLRSTVPRAAWASISIVPAKNRSAPTGLSQYSRRSRWLRYHLAHNKRAWYRTRAMRPTPSAPCCDRSNAAAACTDGSYVAHRNPNGQVGNFTLADLSTVALWMTQTSKLVPPMSIRPHP